MLRSSVRVSLVAALFVLAACGGGTSSSNPGAGGSAGASGAAGASGGSSSTGGAGGSGTGGSSAGAAGTAAPGAGGSSSAGSGGSSSAGAAGSSNAGAAGSSSAGSVGSGGSSRGGSGGAAGSGGSSSGGTSGGRGGASGSGAGGAAGRGGSSSGGSGGTGATACTRELLRSTITTYFTALAAHSASTLPTASNVKFTENGRGMTLGQGLWMTAGAVKYSQSALDVEICSSATHAVVPEGSMDIAFALRLKLVNQQITEIETIAVRPGDYKLSGATQPLMPSGISAANSTIMWETAAPSGQRNTRAELTAWIDKYFREFPMGVCNAVSSCRRLENGAGNFNCAGGGAGGSCTPGDPSGTPVMVPRILIGDPETGIAVGMTMFMGNTDMHMIKMYGGQVYAVHAVLGGATSSGWE